MKRAVIGGVAAAAVVAGGALLVNSIAAPSLPDVQFPAVQLSSAQGNDAATVQWLDLFAQTSATNSDSSGGFLLDPNPSVPGESPLVLIDPQTTEDFDQILDGVVGNIGGQLSAVTSPLNGPDAVTYLILKNGS